MLFLVAAFGAAEATAETFYISRDGSNGDALRWSTAWTDFDRINWNALSPGDLVLIDGGASEMFYSGKLDSRKGGTGEDARITFRRATEPGRDGKVFMSGQIKFSHPWLTLDGVDRNKFDFFASGGYSIHLNTGGDHGEIKNLFIHGEYNATWGVSLAVFAEHALVHGCTFVRSPYEDQVFINLGSGIFQYCDFIELEPDPRPTDDPDRAHRDVMSLVIPQGKYAVIRYCRFRNISTTGSILGLSGAGGAAIDQGRYEIYYNTFEGMPSAVKFDSRIESFEGIEVHNNLFRDTHATTGSTAAGFMQLRNNIFTGAGPTGRVFLGVGEVQASLWDEGTQDFASGPGNIEGDPGWTDAAAGDFRLASGSPAIDAGTELGLLRDIDGRMIVGAPDIGPFEFDSGQDIIGDVPPPFEGIVEVDPPPAPESGIVSFTLIDADTDQPIAGFDPIAGNAVLNFDLLPTKNINIRANFDGTDIESVIFDMDGTNNVRLENEVPYALYGDDDGDYDPGTPLFGTHTIRATPYPRNNGQGTPGESKTLTFSVGSATSAAVSSLDFTVGDQGWTATDFIPGSATAAKFHSVKGLCLQVPEVGNHGGVWTSPEDTLELMPNVVYRMRVAVSSDQPAVNRQPLWDIGFHNFHTTAGNFGGTRLFLDNMGGANGILTEGRTAGHSSFTVFVLPIAIELPAWNDLSNPASPLHPTNSIYGMTLFTKVMDIGSHHYLADLDYGTFCLKSIAIEAIPLEAFVPTEVVFNAPIDEAFYTLTDPFLSISRRFRGRAFIDNAADEARIFMDAPRFDGDVPAGFQLFPEIDAETSGFRKMWPIIWEPETVYGAKYTISAPEGEDDPVNMINIVIDTPTTELMLNDYLTQGFGATGSPKNEPGVYRTFFYSHNVSLSENDDLTRLRTYIRFFNRYDIIGEGRDPITVHDITVEKYETPASVLGDG